MSDKAELDLVLKAVASGLSHCVRWKDERVKDRVRLDTGLAPYGFRAELARCLNNGTYAVKQTKELREWHRDYYEYVYHFVIPFTGFVCGYYAEIVLDDKEDIDLPVVSIVSTHPQTE